MSNKSTCLELPLNSLQYTVLETLVHGWQLSLDYNRAELKKKIVKELRRSWWNELFNKKTPDDVLFEKQFSALAYFEVDTENRSKENDIQEITSLLAAHRVAKATNSKSSYLVSDKLIRRIQDDMGLESKVVPQ